MSIACPHCGHPLRPEPRPLTPRQAEALRVIQEYVDEHGYAPSRTDMCRALELGSKSGAHRLVGALAAKGWIDRAPAAARGIRLLHRLPSPDEPAIAITEAGTRYLAETAS